VRPRGIRRIERGKEVGGTGERRSRKSKRSSGKAKGRKSFG